MAHATVVPAVERGESFAARRLLLALYHPSHLFLLLTDDKEEEGRLRQVMSRQAALSERRNIRVLAGGQEVSSGGSSRLAAILRLAHAAVTVTGTANAGGGSGSSSSGGRSSGRRGTMVWDWFIYLRADDYPLTTPDGEIEGG